jgi:hypothetical protein
MDRSDIYTGATDSRDGLATGPVSPEFVARFFARVDKCGPVPSHRPELGACHVWTGYCTAQGYGQVSGVTVSPGRRRGACAHRVAFFIHHGHWPRLLCLHRCDNPSCVRWDHLFEGTDADNVADKVSKRREARGVIHGSARLNPEIVREIRRRHGCGESVVAIAADFGVTHQNISRITRGQTWTDVE